MNSKATAFSRSQLYAGWLRPVLHLPREVGCRDAAAWHTAPKSTTLVDSLGPDNNGEIIAFVHMCSRPKGGGYFSSSDSEWEHTTHQLTRGSIYRTLRSVPLLSLSPSTPARC